MKKTPEQIWEDFQKELVENDKKVNAEINKKSDEQKAKEFARFIKDNKCKVVGGKNEKSRKRS